MTNETLTNEEIRGAENIANLLLEGPIIENYIDKFIIKKTKYYYPPSLTKNFDVGEQLALEVDCSCIVDHYLDLSRHMMDIRITQEILQEEIEKEEKRKNNSLYRFFTRNKIKEKKRLCEIVNERARNYIDSINMESEYRLLDIIAKHPEIENEDAFIGLRATAKLVIRIYKSFIRGAIIDFGVFEKYLKNEDIKLLDYDGENIFYINKLNESFKADDKVDKVFIEKFINQIKRINDKEWNKDNALLTVTFGGYDIRIIHPDVIVDGSTYITITKVIKP